MKKILVFLIGLVLLLTGCGDGDSGFPDISGTYKDNHTTLVLEKINSDIYKVQAITNNNNTLWNEKVTLTGKIKVSKATKENNRYTIPIIEDTLTEKAEKIILKNNRLTDNTRDYVFFEPVIIYSNNELKNKTTIRIFSFSNLEKE